VSRLGDGEPARLALTDDPHQHHDPEVREHARSSTSGSGVVHEDMSSQFGIARLRRHVDVVVGARPRPVAIRPDDGDCKDERLPERGEVARR
jgi:hypothetical protein